MTETTTGKQFFTVARVFFLLIVIPLSLMSLLIANGIFELGDISKKRAVTVLDQKSQEEMKIRTITTAESVADFLRTTERDILIATILPANEKSYKEFIDKNKQVLWVRKDGAIVKSQEPLYTEMSLVDKRGNELIKITGGETASQGALKNVSDPKNTTFKSEDYFARTKSLAKGEIYMSHVTGWYVNRSDFEKGVRYKGIIRLATPVFDQQGFAGIITLALDVRHLAKFTDNIIPTQAQYVYEADAASGNYAYMVDDRGFVISHPNDYHIAGLDKDGVPMLPLTQENSQEMSSKGQEVLNLNLLGSMDPALPEITSDAHNGKSGVKIYKFGGHTKVVAYAPVPFYSKDYPAPAGFGWVGLGVDVDKFNELATDASKKIEKEARAWMVTIVLIIIIAVVLLFGISAILARGISRSITREVPEDALEAAKYYDDEEDD
jgi:hypothetical protein